MNVLDELYHGRITEDEAYDFVESIIDSDDAPQIRELSGMNPAEYTAFGHGAGLKNVATWRHEGWPKVCGRCSKPIEPEAYGWLIHEMSDGTRTLKHIECPPP